MKKIILSFIVLASASAFATDGRTTECFDVAVTVPKAIDANGPVDSNSIKTGAMVCTVERNMKYEDPDGIVATGDITITITEGKKQIAQYKMGAVSGEGAAGTFYNYYGKTKADVASTDDNAYKLVEFIMRNDHIKKGEFAGYVKINGSSLTLIQR